METRLPLCKYLAVLEDITKNVTECERQNELLAI